MSSLIKKSFTPKTQNNHQSLGATTTKNNNKKNNKKKKVVVFAGKTGTAQVIGIKQDIEKRKQEHELSYYSRSHGWFTSYGPYKNPQYVVTVLVEHGGHGGHAAGDIVSKIYNKLLELGYIKK